MAGLRKMHDPKLKLTIKGGFGACDNSSQAYQNMLGVHAINYFLPEGFLAHLTRFYTVALASFRSSKQWLSVCDWYDQGGRLVKEEATVMLSPLKELLYDVEHLTRRAWRPIGELRRFFREPSHRSRD